MRRAINRRTDADRPVVRNERVVDLDIRVLKEQPRASRRLVPDDFASRQRDSRPCRAYSAAGVFRPIPGHGATVQCHVTPRDRYAATESRRVVTDAARAERTACFGERDAAADFRVIAGDDRVREIQSRAIVSHGDSAAIAR